MDASPQGSKGQEKAWTGFPPNTAQGATERLSFKVVFTKAPHFCGALSKCFCHGFNYPVVINDEVKGDR